MLLGKDDERELQERSRAELGHPFGEHLCAPVDDVVGRRLDVRHDRDPDLLRLHRPRRRDDRRALGARLALAGVPPGRHRAARLRARHVPGRRPRRRARSSGWAHAPVPVGAEAGSERLLRMAELVRPRALACTPSYRRLPRRAGAEGPRPPASELGIEIIRCAGEPGAGLPEVRARLQQAFGARVHDMLGGAHGVMCCSCDAEPYAGMHVLGRTAPSTTQLVDQETRAPVPVVEGAVGERVKTSLRWEAQPQLRASVGDVYQVHTDPCSCGVPARGSGSSAAPTTC